MIGTIINNWTVKERIGNFYRCICKCGTASVRHMSEVNPQKMSKQCRKCSGTTKHGMSSHPLYNVWINVIDKCKNPKHKDWSDFGGKGIKVVERWHNIHNFIKDMGSRPEGYALARRDLSADFGPDNCYWGKFSDVLAQIKAYNQQFKRYKKRGRKKIERNSDQSMIPIISPGTIATDVIEEKLIDEIIPIPETSIKSIAVKEVAAEKLLREAVLNRIDALRILQQKYHDEEKRCHDKRKAIEELLNSWQDLESNLTKILKD
jgi:hypothetical protein